MSKQEINAVVDAISSTTYSLEQPSPSIFIRGRAVLGAVRFGLLRRYRAWKFRGKGLSCTVCGKEFAKFMSDGISETVLEENSVIGGGYRENATCPWCVSRERTRLTALYLIEAEKLFSGKPYKVMHVAPENCLVNFIRKHPSVDLLTVDLYSPYADERIDITDIKKPDDFFDVVLCSHVLEHVTDDLAAMRELNRVLKPTGFAILQVPISLTNSVTLEDNTVVTESDRLAKYGQKDHVRLYGQDYTDRLAAAGFTVDKYRPSPEIIRKFALNPEEYLFVGRPNLGAQLPN